MSDKVILFGEQPGGLGGPKETWLDLALARPAKPLSDPSDEEIARARAGCPCDVPCCWADDHGADCRCCVRSRALALAEGGGPAPDWAVPLELLDLGAEESFQLSSGGIWVREHALAGVAA